MLPTLLVVDDEDDVREAFSDVFNSDFKVLLASSGKEAVEMIEKNQIDVVLTDYNMPGMDGLELLEVINKGPVKIPVVALSGRGNHEIEHKFLNQGAFEYLQKPCNLVVLMEVLKRATDINHNKG